ncbi:hypothetical protein BZA77DRAFT_328756 [Pyronema omphalodes]|nr:hypothetical protein BZA77DRAFT_328756 [Pyronema omphalodes]
MAVISGLDEMVRAKLLKGNSLNISPFSFQDLPRVLHRLEVTKCTPKVKRDFFVQVWESYQKHGTGEDLEMLQKLPIVAAVSKNPSGYLFLTVDDFREHKYPAMMSIQLSRFESQGQNAMAVFNVLEKHGLLLIDRATFPRWLARTRWVEDEEVDKHGGLYRLLRCIEALCQKSHRSIESFISAEFGREPGLLEKLGDVLGYCNWMYCNNQQHAAYARSLLRNFPIIPCSKRDGSPVRYLSSRNALLEPTTSLNLDSIPRTQYFVCKDWASNHRGELEFLSLEPMSIQDFLMQEFSVEQGSQLPAELLVQYVQILGEIASNMRSVLPIALDGTRRFRFVRTLYDHRNNLFEAAFHHIKDESFLHPKLRNIGWSTMIEQITSNNVYWTCVRGIQIQAENPKYNDATLVDRARRVFDFIRWDTQALRSICEDGRVHSWLNVPFVPAMYVDINNTIRNSTMRGKVPPNRLIAPTAGILSEYADICWSQTPFFCEKPAASVLALLPGQGEPTVQMVLSHLKFLSEKRHEINSSEFPSFIENAKACYRYLQALDQKITVSKDHEIWFNTDEENPDREVFNKSWVSTKNLCLGLEYDSRNLQYVRSSLQSFFPLLKNCNVRTIRGPVASPPPTRKNGDIPYSSTLLTQFQKFRAEQRFIDVYIIIDGRKLGVHKTVLCAASEYFQTMFGNPMREETERIIDWNSAGFTAQTAERLIEWIYTGEMPTITPSDPTDEMEQLLELMGAANCYLLQDLKDFVAHSLRSARYIRPETVLEVKRYAIENDTKGLIKECEEYIAQYWDIIERESADLL